MGVKTQNNQKNDIPGPGQYGQNGSIKYKQPPAFGFGSSTRSKQKADGAPGPGQYKIPVEVAKV